MSGIVFEKLTQFLSAGQVWRLTIAADFFRIAAASWPVKVRILKAGRILGEMDGWQAGDFVRDVEFDAVEVEVGSNAQTVKVQIAGGGVGSDRVLGEVSVIDGGKSRTAAGIAFSGLANQVGVAGNFAQVQLWNPAGSGKRIFIEQMLIGVTAADGASIYPALGMLTTDLGAASSKKIGGAPASARLKKSSVTVYPYSAQPLAGVNLQASGNATYKLTEPLCIEEGSGISVIASTTGNSVQATFEFFEEQD